MTISHSLRVPGGYLHYEVRGAGPLLLIMGAPLATVLLVPLAEALARDFTVVIYDSPGVSDVAVDNSVQEPAPDREADAAVALLNVLGPESADVFGSCVGAVAGLAMVTQYPGRVRTLVAHEPPLPELLPGASELRARIDGVVENLHHEGVEAAWRKFMTTPEFHTSDESALAALPGQDPGQDYVIDAGSHDCEMWRVRYLPDVSLLNGGSTRVVVGVGMGSGGLSAYSSMTLAGLLGVTAVGFPGEHSGFLERPEEFADKLRRMLIGGQQDG